MFHDSDVITQLCQFKLPSLLIIVNIIQRNQALASALSIGVIL